MEKFNIPTSWNEINIAQYIDLISVKLDDKSIYEKYIEWLSIITDSMPEEWEDMDVDDVAEIIKTLPWIKKEPSNNYKSIILDRKLMDLNKLTLGEFIDLDHFSKDNENFHIVIAILYRKFKVSDWGNDILEPYDELPLFKRADELLNIPITDVYGTYKLYLKFKEDFFLTYQNHFNTSAPEEDLDPIEDLTPEEQIDEKKEAEMARYSWENLLYYLCDGDITKQNKVLNLSVIEVFNHLSYKKVFNK